jgi:hypothetical protein
MYVIGLLFLGIGCAAYDWRFGAIVVGIVLLGGAALGGWRL